MIAKGKSIYREMIETTIVSLRSLFSIVEKEIKPNIERISADADVQMQQLKELYEKDGIPLDGLCGDVWKYYEEEMKLYDSILDDMYISLLQRLYAFCEITLKELLGNRKYKGQNGLSKLERYYEGIRECYTIEMPELPEACKKYHQIHILRNGYTHEYLYEISEKDRSKSDYFEKRLTADFIGRSINEVERFLLVLEEKINGIKL